MVPRCGSSPGDPALGEMMVMNYRAAELVAAAAGDARLRGAS